MGYYYDANYTLTVTETAQVTAVLDLPRLAAQRGAGFRTVDFSGVEADFAAAGKPIIAYLLEEQLYAEIGETQTLPDGSTRYTGWVNAKYRAYVDHIWAYLASVGATFEVTATGEDGEMWTYRADATTGYRCETLDALPRSEIARLRADAAALADLRALAQHDPTISRERLLAAVLSAAPVLVAD